MSTKYFQNFEKIYYQFGDENSHTLFQNIGQYVDVLDQVKSQQTFYEDYTIKSGDRPDTLSLQLYGDPSYYWTFFLLNDDLRESGWPLMNEELLDRAKKFYPHRVLTTTHQISDETEGKNFGVGKKVVGQDSGTIGTIIKRNLDLGQLVVDTTKAFNTEDVDFTLAVNSNGAVDIEVDQANQKFYQPEVWVLHKYPTGTRENGVVITGHSIVLDEIDTVARLRSIAFEVGYDFVLTTKINTFNNSDSVFLDTEQIYFINSDTGLPVFARLYSEVAQYNAIHHYENSDGEEVDVDPYSETRSSSLTAVTNYDRVESKNNSLKQMKILKPSAVDTVVKEFYRLMLER